MNDSPRLKIATRHLPHWELEGSFYYITFRVKQGTLHDTEASVLRKRLLEGHGKHCQLIAFVIMPNHVHLVLSPRQGMTLSRILKGIKGKSAREINTLRKTSGPVWQAESFDRIIRDETELTEKLNYMLNNPVRARLTANSWEYEGWYFNTDIAASPQ